MSFSSRLAHPVWIAAVLVALGTTLWMHQRRVAQVEHVTAQGNPRTIPDANSPTGYAGGVRALIAPGANIESYQWIVQTQHMLASGEWRVRTVDYDNAPTGRAVDSPSPYRWWLATAAQVDRLVSGNSRGLAVERAAVWADPALHVIVLLAASVFALWRFGALSGAVLALGLAFLFPWAGVFVAGAPEDGGLTRATLLMSLLSLVAAVHAEVRGSGSPRRWCGLSGAWGGLTLWLNPGCAVPMAVAIGCGAWVHAWIARRAPGTSGMGEVDPFPWRTWGAWGAGVGLAGYLIEFAPSHLAWTAPGFREVHPLYAFAWLGWGELVHRSAARLRGVRFAVGPLGWLVALLSFSAVVALPVAMIEAHDGGFLAPESFYTRLTALFGGIAADSFAAWTRPAIATLPYWSTLAPVFLLVPALAGALDRTTPHDSARATGLLMMPAFAALGFAWFQLSWWITFDVVLLALAVGLTIGDPTDRRTAGTWVVWLGGIGILLLPGLWLLAVKPLTAHAPDLTPEDLQSIAERDVAHWLAYRADSDGAVVLAPPHLTASLIFHGGLRGLGSPYRENSAGFAAAVRIAAASSADEAEALARQRTLTHIVIPSWDTFLDDYASLGTNAVEHSLVGLLHAWLPPRWLEPIVYHPPALPELAGERVNVFEVTEVQDLATCWARMAIYFAEMGDLRLATELCGALAEKHAEDFGGLVATARTQAARGQRFLLSKTLETIEARIAEAADEGLPWDLRVSLSLVLADGQHEESARMQAGLCADTAGERDLRRLSHETLRRFAVLCQQFGLSLPEPALQQTVERRLMETAGTKR